MNIILGKQAADKLSQKYTVLELDTFKFRPNEEPVKSYCVVELTDFQDFVSSSENSEKHCELISNFQSGNWDESLKLIGELYGSWSGDIDSFYDDLKARIEKLKSEEDGKLYVWSYVIDRTGK